MITHLSPAVAWRFALILASPLAACADSAPVAPARPSAVTTRVVVGSTATANDILATLRAATARYHDLNAAIADGYVFLHGCEVRSDEGPVGTVYVNMHRLLDGVIDPSLPDGLIYEPHDNSPPTLVAAELAVPYALWTGQQPPTFLGATFQREDEFGVFGLHVWIWRNNPDGLFAEANPNVSCTAE
jgi:hypothetical protein